MVTDSYFSRICEGYIRIFHNLGSWSWYYSQYEVRGLIFHPFEVGLLTYSLLRMSHGALTCMTYPRFELTLQNVAVEHTDHDAKRMAWDKISNNLYCHCGMLGLNPDYFQGWSLEFKVWIRFIWDFATEIRLILCPWIISWLISS